MRREFVFVFVPVSVPARVLVHVPVLVLVSVRVLVPVPVHVPVPASVLAVADTCVFAELCWVPSAREQAEARIHRMGQQSSSVPVYYIVAGGPASPDEVMFNTLARKADTVSRVVDRHY